MAQLKKHEQATKSLERLLKQHGGTFVRETTNGFRLWRLAGHAFSLPLKERDLRASRTLEREIRAAIADAKQRRNGHAVTQKETVTVLGLPVTVDIPLPPPPPVVEAAATTALNEPSFSGDEGVVTDSDDVSAALPATGVVTPAAPTTAAGLLQCPECGRAFRTRMHMGRHRTAMHGVESKFGKTITTPLTAHRPGAAVLAPSAAMADFQATLTLLMKQLNDVVVEGRMIREENARLRETVEQMRQAFDVIRKKTR